MNDVCEYLDALVERVRALLGEELVGVYAGGSFALGAYRSGHSDLDVAVVCRGPLPVATKAQIGEALRHESLPCPARGLELVVYPEATARGGTGDPGYELNLNTGRAMPYLLSLAPEGEAHWYAIDRAIVREHGVALAGPLPGELFAPIPRDVLLSRVLESVRWYAQHREAGRDDAVLNACRAWRFASEGVWSSKPAAGEWARGRTDEAAAIAAALDGRLEDGELEHVRVDAFLEGIVALLEDARAHGSLHS